MRSVWLVVTFVLFGIVACAQDSSLEVYPTFLVAAFTHDAMDLRQHNPLPIITVPVTINNFYGEARYNYDMIKTFGAYGGKIFSISEAHTLIPQAGALLGDYRGASVQLYYSWAAKWFEINFQNQYSFSATDNDNFYYNWSDMQFKIHTVFRVGGSVQLLFQDEIAVMDGGIYFACRKPTFTLAAYSFNFYNSKAHYLIVGVQWKLGLGTLD